MTSRIDFPDGNWIELRDAAEVPERLRRPHLIASAMAYEANESKDWPAQVGHQRRAAALGAIAVITAWSWPTAITVDALEDLPIVPYDLIIDATASRVEGLRWTTVATPEAMADPKATFDGSSSSTPGWPTPTP